MKNNRLVEVPSSVKKIAVSNYGPWAVNNAGSIYQRKNGRWVKKPGCAKDIGASPSGKVWVLGCGNRVGGYSIHFWDGGKWTRTAGGATSIAVDKNGNPYISKYGDIYWSSKVKLAY